MPTVSTVTAEDSSRLTPPVVLAAATVATSNSIGFNVANAPMFPAASSRAACANTFTDTSPASASLMLPVPAITATEPHTPWLVSVAPIRSDTVRASATPSVTLVPACTRMFPPPVCSLAPSLIVTAPLATRSTVPRPPVLTEPVALRFTAPPASTLAFPLAVLTVAFNCTSPAACTSTSPAPVIVRPAPLAFTPSSTVTAPVTARTRSQPLLPATRSLVPETDCTALVVPPADTRLMATVPTVSTVTSVSSCNETPAFTELAVTVATSTGRYGSVPAARSAVTNSVPLGSIAAPRSVTASGVPVTISR